MHQLKKVVLETERRLSETNTCYYIFISLNYFFPHSRWVQGLFGEEIHHEYERYSHVSRSPYRIATWLDELSLFWTGTTSLVHKCHLSLQSDSTKSVKSSLVGDWWFLKWATPPDYARVFVRKRRSDKTESRYQLFGTSGREPGKAASMQLSQRLAQLEWYLLHANSKASSGEISVGK